MEDIGYRSWKEFVELQNRRGGTVQLCIDELAEEMYFDDGADKKEKCEDEFLFD